MNRSLGYAAAFLALAAQAVFAQAQTQPNLSGPGFQQLQAMADNPAAVGDAMDGNVPRKEGPLTILDERTYEERTYHPEQESTTTRSDYDYYYYTGSHSSVYHGGYYYDYHGCPAGYHQHSFPRYSNDHQKSGAYTEVTKGTLQKVRIDDRGAYVRNEATRGGLWGAILGAVAIGLTAVLAGPVGIVAGAAAVITAGWAGINALNASDKPSIFERIVNRTTSAEKP